MSKDFEITLLNNTLANHHKPYLDARLHLIDHDRLMNHFQAMFIQGFRTPNGLHRVSLRMHTMAISKAHLDLHDFRYIPDVQRFNDAFMTTSDNQPGVRSFAFPQIFTLRELLAFGPHQINYIYRCLTETWLTDKPIMRDEIIQTGFPSQPEGYMSAVFSIECVPISSQAEISEVGNVLKPAKTPVEAFLNNHFPSGHTGSWPVQVLMYSTFASGVAALIADTAIEISRTLKSGRSVGAVKIDRFENPVSASIGFLDNQGKVFKQLKISGWICAPMILGKIKHFFEQRFHSNPVYQKAVADQSKSDNATDQVNTAIENSATKQRGHLKIV